MMKNSDKIWIGLSNAFNDPYVSICRTNNTFVLFQEITYVSEVGSLQEGIVGPILGKTHRTRLKLRTKMGLTVRTEQI